MCDEESDTRKTLSSGSISYQSIPDADREVAAMALQSFDLQKYEQSLLYVKKLASKRPQDPKVYHNQAVVEFYLSQGKKTEQLNKKLLEVRKQAHIDVQEPDTLDDNCVILYNQSVVLYHLHQYHSALSLLDKVYLFIESIEETIAKNVIFLLLECCLAVYHPKKALSLISFMEVNSGKGCNKSKDKELSKEDNVDNCLSEVHKRKLQLCKARCYSMMKTSKACKREIKNLMSSGSNVQNIPAFYLKSQLEYQRGNYRKALKLLNSVTLPDDISKYFRETGDCLPALFYNNVGCIHFYMGKPNLGQFYIEKALQAFETEIKLVTDSTENRINSRPLHLMSISTQHQLIYNLGMQYLQGQKFEKAFNCFTEVVPSYHANPRLWLRIAECCIQIHNPDNMKHFIGELECKRRPFVKSVVGYGPHRKLILNSSSDKNLNEETKVNTSPDFETPSLQLAMLCLKNALYFVGENPSASTGDSEPNTPSSSEETDTAQTEENNLPTLPTNYIQGTEVISLRNSILIASSYVSLCVGDVILAHYYAKTLLCQPRVSAAHKFLANMYAGESLLIMDKITDAVDHLNFPCTSDIELALPVSSSEISLKHQIRFDNKLTEKNDDGSRPVGNIPNWLPNSISSAEFITHYNLAVAYAVREEWSKALECLQQMNPDGTVPLRAVSLLIYVQAHQGTAEEAKTYVKQYIVPRLG